MKTSVLALILAALTGAACGNKSQSTTAPAATSTPTFSGSLQTFQGALAPQGSAFYSFTVAAAETVSLSLASVTANSIGPASTSILRLGLGVPIGTGCSVNTSVDTAAGLTVQLTAAVTPDVYCVNISDIGALTAPMNFTIRVGHDVAPLATSTTAGTETFASFLAFRGASAHTFSVSQSGTISLTLTSVTPSSIVGLGIGIPGASTPICSLSRTLSATAGSTSQITIPVDAGTYCAEVYDAGALNAPGASFSMTIAHP